MIAERLIFDLEKKSELQRATFSWSLWGKKALPSTAAEIDAWHRDPAFCNEKEGLGYLESVDIIV